MATENIKVHVLTMTGQKTSYMVPPSISIAEFQEMVSEETGIMPRRQKLVTVKKMPLDSSKTLADYNVRNNFKIFMIVMMEDFQSRLETRGQEFFLIACYRDGTTEMPRYGPDKIELWVEFDGSNPTAWKRRYVSSGNGTWNVDWNKHLIAITKGCPVYKKYDNYKFNGTAMETTQENIMTVKYYHQSDRNIWNFVFYHEDVEQINNWTQCFTGLGAATDLALTNYEM